MAYLLPASGCLAVLVIVLQSGVIGNALYTHATALARFKPGPTLGPLNFVVIANTFNVPRSLLYDTYCKYKNDVDQ